MVSVDCLLNRVLIPKKSEKLLLILRILLILPESIICSILDLDFFFFGVDTSARSEATEADLVCFEGVSELREGELVSDRLCSSGSGVPKKHNHRTNEINAVIDHGYLQILVCLKEAKDQFF